MIQKIFFIILFISSPLFAKGKKEVCMYDYEKEAIHFRSIFTNMAVAGSVCKELQLYNKCVTYLNPILEKNSLVLEILFLRMQGSAKGKKTLNEFVTSVANESSLKSLYNKKEYCNKYISIMHEVLNLDLSDIKKFTNKYAYLSIEKPSICKTSPKILKGE